MTTGKHADSGCNYPEGECLGVCLGKTPIRECACCGAADYSVSFTQKSEVKQKMDADGICWDCAFWRVEVKKKHETVISGRIYSVGDVTKKPGSPFAGMAGRRFDIEYFDGRIVTTHDLWSGGKIPDEYRQQIPDTARFLGGAGFVKIGDGGAWNPSRKPDATRSASHD